MGTVWSSAPEKHEMSLVSKIYQCLKPTVIGARFLRYPPGHYYSPIPDIRQIRRRQDSIGRESKECPAIDLRETEQLDLLNKLAAYYGELPFSVHQRDSNRYYYDNSFFSYADAIVLFGMLRHFRPIKIIEVGSGFSSAVMLDTNDAFFQSQTHFTFIEPYPDRLNSLLTDSDRDQCVLIPRTVQDVELDLFETLEANDILFIDSSHIVKTGSDLVRIVFEILPRLKRGVIVHFHDILWPFDYPKEWFNAGRAWNESYFVRAFLQFNSSFEILYFNAFMDAFHKDTLRTKMPLCLDASSDRMTLGASSLWLRKVA